MEERKLFLSHTLHGETVGLEEIDDGVWSLYYGVVLLARFDGGSGGSMGDLRQADTHRRAVRGRCRTAQSNTGLLPTEIIVRLESAPTLPRLWNIQAIRLSLAVAPTRRKCYPCSRSVLLSMLPVAQTSWAAPYCADIPACECVLTASSISCQ